MAKKWGESNILTPSKIKLAFPAHLLAKILHQKPDGPLALCAAARILSQAFVSELWLFNCRLCPKVWLDASFARAK
jgi:hypothetical protein